MSNKAWKYVNIIERHHNFLLQWKTSLLYQCYRFLPEVLNRSLLNHIIHLWCQTVRSINRSLADSKRGHRVPCISNAAVNNMHIHCMKSQIFGISPKWLVWMKKKLWRIYTYSFKSFADNYRWIWYTGCTKMHDKDILKKGKKEPSFENRPILKLIIQLIKAKELVVGKLES